MFPPPRRLALLLLLALTVSAAPAAADAPWHVFRHEHVLGTSLELRFVSATPTDAARAEEAALKEIDRLAGVLSGYDKDSEVSRWAATRGEARTVSPDLFRVLSLFDTWRDRTHGAVDAAAEGDIVFIEPGTYNEAVSVTTSRPGSDHVPVFVIVEPSSTVTSPSFATLGATLLTVMVRDCAD